MIQFLGGNVHILGYLKLATLKIDWQYIVHKDFFFSMSRQSELHDETELLECVSKISTNEEEDATSVHPEAVMLIDAETTHSEQPCVIAHHVTSTNVQFALDEYPWTYGFATFTAVEGTTNTIGVTLLMPPYITPVQVLGMICPWSGCYSTMIRSPFYLGIYFVYAVYVFLWKIVELCQVSTMPNDILLADGISTWELQLFIVSVMVRSWIVIYTLLILRIWLRPIEFEVVDYS